MLMLFTAIGFIKVLMWVMGSIMAAFGAGSYPWDRR
jgi:hypothetical protein